MNVLLGLISEMRATELYSQMVIYFYYAKKQVIDMILWECI